MAQNSLADGKMNRYGESGGIPARQKRVYLKNKQWYFMTRSSIEYGPFDNLTEAKRELALYLRRSGVVRFRL